MCSLLAIADLLVAAHADGVVRVWRVTVDVDSSSCSSTLQAEVVLPGRVVPTVLIHPDTYLNKVAVGTASGSVCIVNVRSGRVIHECRIAQGAVAVTAIAQVSSNEVF